MDINRPAPLVLLLPEAADDGEGPKSFGRVPPKLCGEMEGIATQSPIRSLDVLLIVRCDQLAASDLSFYGNADRVLPYPGLTVGTNSEVRALALVALPSPGGATLRDRR
jgi:hypothetical protein